MSKESFLLLFCYIFATFLGSTTSTDNKWTINAENGPMFAASTVTTVQLYRFQALGTKQPTIRNTGFKTILESPTYTYDKIAVSTHHNLIIYLKFNTDQLWAAPIRPDEKNYMNIEGVTDLKIAEVNIFTVDWTDENIYIGSKKSNIITIISMANTDMRYFINTASDHITELYVDETNNFLAWTENKFRLAMANKDGSEVRTIAEHSGMSSMDCDPVSQRFYYNINSDNNNQLYSQSFTPMGAPILENNYGIDGSARIFQTIFYSNDQVKYFVQLTGEENPSSKGYKLWIHDILNRGGDHKRRRKRSNDTLLIGPRDKRELNVNTDARGLCHVWVQPSNGYCKNRDDCLDGITLRLQSDPNICRCVCKKVDDEIDCSMPFDFEPNAETEAPNEVEPPEEEVEPEEVIEENLTVTTIVNDTSGFWRTMLILFPILLLFVTCYGYSYLQSPTDEIYRSSKERPEQEASTDSARAREIRRAERAFRKKMKNETFLGTIGRSLQSVIVSNSSEMEREGRKIVTPTHLDEEYEAIIKMDKEIEEEKKRKKKEKKEKKRRKKEKRSKKRSKKSTKYSSERRTSKKRSKNRKHSSDPKKRRKKRTSKHHKPTLPETAMMYDGLEQIKLLRNCQSRREHPSIPTEEIFTLNESVKVYKGIPLKTRTLKPTLPDCPAVTIKSLKLDVKKAPSMSLDEELVALSKIEIPIESEIGLRFKSKFEPEKKL